MVFIFLYVYILEGLFLVKMMCIGWVGDGYVECGFCLFIRVVGWMDVWFFCVVCWFLMMNVWCEFVMDRVGYLCRFCRWNGRDFEMGWRVLSLLIWKGVVVGWCLWLGRGFGWCGLFFFYGGGEVIWIGFVEEMVDCKWGNVKLVGKKLYRF